MSNDSVKQTFDVDIPDSVIDAFAGACECVGNRCLSVLNRPVRVDASNTNNIESISINEEN